MRWNHAIRLGGEDVTGRTTLNCEITEVRGGSALMDFTYFPLHGVQDPAGLALEPVEIDVDMGSGMTRLFTGKVIRVVWDPKTASYSVRASTRIQEHFRALGSEDAVLAALPGASYSRGLFGDPPDDLWEYAERCLETLESDIYLDRTGALVITPIQEKGTADVFLGASVVHERDGFRLDLPSADEQINRVIVEFDYVVRRKKVRYFSVSWGVTPCAWLVGEGTEGAPTNTGFTAPTIDVVSGPLTGSSWHADQVNYEHPESGGHVDYCFPGHNWTNLDSAIAPQVLLGASVNARRGFTQEIVETYKLTIDATATQIARGAIVTQRLTGSRPTRTDAWPEGTPPRALNWQLDSIGDYFEDDEVEADREADLNSAYAWGKATIRKAQRQGSLTFTTDLDPGITLDDTIEVNCYGTQAKGVARELRFILGDIPRCEITIALSAGAGGSTTPWIVPGRSTIPDDPVGYWESVNDPGYIYPVPSIGKTLATLLGNSSNSPPIPDPDDREDAWITNYTVPLGSPDPDQVYEEDFRVTWPEVEAEALSSVSVESPYQYEIAVNASTLLISS